MLGRVFSPLWLICLLIMLSSCSGGSPVESPLTGEILQTRNSIQDHQGAGSINHVLWGLWQAKFDFATADFSIVPTRLASFHLNLVNQLQEPMPPGISLSVNSFKPQQGFLDLDVTITHPYPNSNFRGFDVRGIFMGSGETITSEIDPAVVYPASNGLRLLNADGYTRWWNAQEFTTPGFFGYVSGQLGYPGFISEATVNPYKYYSDPLSPEDPVMPAVNPSNRGTFSTTPEPHKLTRNYKLQFPIIDGYPEYIIQYAIDTNWATPTGTSSTPKPVDDYPLHANCPEAYHVTVDTAGTTAYYVSETNNGGDLILKIEVFDWGAIANPSGIDGEIESITIESPTLFDSPVIVPVVSTPGSQLTSGIYAITIPDIHPIGLEGQEVFITVKSYAPTTYESPISFPEYPVGAELAAYALVEIPISDQDPGVDSISVINPDGGETWVVGFEEKVLWHWTGAFPAVDISLSLDGGLSYTILLADDAPNTGEFIIEQVGSWLTEQARVKVESSANPSVNDESDEEFTIEESTAPITVVTPNGGESYAVGQSVWLQWAADPDIANVMIELSLDSGVEYTYVVTNSTQNDGYFNLVSIPPEAAGEQCRIKVSDTGDPGVFDESDGDFEIYHTDKWIKVTEPNGGETWGIGNIHYVRWDTNDLVSKVNIDISLDGGFTWPYQIATYIDNYGGFNIKGVPDYPTDQARIRVVDATDSSIFDISDADFTVELLGYVTVLSPNGGEIWDVGSNQEITWSGHASAGGGSITIYYSTDSGDEWDTLIESVNNSGSFEWNNIQIETGSENCRIKIRIITAFGYFSDESDEDFAINFPLPQAPFNFTASQGISAYTIYLDWDPVPNAVYDVFQDDTIDPVVVDLENSDYGFGPPYHDPGVHYDFYVRAKTTGGESDLAGPAEGWACAPVIGDDPPANVVASKGDYDYLIVVNWDDVPDATGYNIYRSDNQDDPIEEDWPYSYYEDNDLELCEHYKYAIQATDGCIASYKSPQVSGWTSEPPTPTGLVASQGTYHDKVVIQWNPVAGITKYLLYRNNFVNPYSWIYNGETEFEDNLVELGTDYYYKIKAWGGSDPDDCSSELSGQVLGYIGTVPGVPINISASQGDYLNKIILNWDDVPDSTGYNIYRDSWDEPIYTDWPDPTFEDLTAAPCTNYIYRISAVNDCGESELSFLPGVEGWTADGPPDIPDWVTASEGNYEGYVLVEWAEVPGATGYKVYRDSWTEPVETIEPVVTWEDHEAGAEHHFYCIRAYNDCEDGPLSAPPAEGWVLKLLPGPGNLIASTDLCDRITITWDEVTEATGYDVYWKTPYITWLPVVKNWPETFWYDFQDPGGFTREYRVRAINDNGNGEWGYSNEGKTGGSPIPEFVELPTQGDFYGKISFRVESCDFALSINVYRDDWETPYDNIPNSGVWYEDTDVIPGKVYNYRLASISSDCGVSPLSVPAHPGWAAGGLEGFVLGNCTELICNSNYVFWFLNYEDVDKLHFSKDYAPWDYTGMDDSTFEWVNIPMGLRHIEFQGEDIYGYKSEIIECDFKRNTPPQVDNLNCPSAPITTPEYTWTWELEDPDALPEGHQTLKVKILIDGPDPWGDWIELEDNATEYLIDTTLFIPGVEYHCSVNVKDGCHETDQTDACSFTVAPPYCSEINCPPPLILPCDGSYNFEWTIDPGGTGLEPGDIYVRVRWSLDDVWVELGQGTDEYEVCWDECEDWNYQTFEIELSATAGDWENPWVGGYCEFYIYHNFGAVIEWVWLPDEYVGYGEPFTIKWSMPDDCTPTNMLKVRVIADGTPIDLPDGTTEFDFVVFEPKTPFRVEATDACDRMGYKETKFTMHDPPSLEITNCPDQVNGGPGYTFEWETSSTWYDTWVKFDDSDWIQIEKGALSQQWVPIPVGTRVFSVKVRDSYYFETIDICEFESV